jgi:hypothetical protein
MIDLNDISARPTTPPATRAEARARIVTIDDAIAAIRTQLAAADMKRQAGRAGLDPDWYHRARTAIRHLQRERAEIQAQAVTLPSGRDRLKDRIIAVVREDYDDDAWQRVVQTARQSLDAEGA